MAYTKKTWVDFPDTSTPITADDLNNIENGIAGVLDWIYPVGTIYETTSTDLDTTTKMANHFGGTWEEYGAGRVLVAKSADTEFDTIGKTGGAKTHTLSLTEMPSHNHGLDESIITFSDIKTPLANGRGSTTTAHYYVASTNGGDQPHNNLQPYIVVYRYRRTA